MCEVEKENLLESRIRRLCSILRNASLTLAGILSMPHLLSQVTNRYQYHQQNVVAEHCHHEVQCRSSFVQGARQ